MTIDETYRLVQTFANKEQRGFLTPVDFNLLAKQAELELYNKRLSIVIEKSQPKKAAGYYQESLSPGVAEQDIAAFLESEFTGVTSNPNAANIGASVPLLTDYIVSMSHSDSETQSMATNIPIEIVNNANINQVLRSSLAKPSTQYPIALIGNSSEATNLKLINIFPDTVTKITVVHYVYNYSPKWDYVTIAGKPVYDAGSSVQFRSPNRLHGELAIKILEYLGVHIRDADVISFAQNKELAQDK